MLNDAPRDVTSAEPDMLERPARLLLVDDQPANIHALYQVFAADHQVFMATDGPKALALCRERRPDVVLLDVVMPGMDGYEVLRRLQADPQTATLPVIFVTAYNDVAAETRGLDLGAVDFIHKPINPTIVRARVRNHVQLAARQERLRQLARYDGLTGLANRRRFDERLDEELRRSQRAAGAMALLMIDVDRFKRYNDHLGHLAGDDCLRRVAEAIRGCMRRPTDFAARYGGEEFACVLGDTGAEGAFEVAQAIRGAVQALALPHPDSDAHADVSVSIGVAAWTPDPVPDGGALLAAADAALYRAKRAGRNRVSVAGDL